jgi:Breast carcinoma amplified sequence 2 (BCAS2)
MTSVEAGSDSNDNQKETSNALATIESTRKRKAVLWDALPYIDPDPSTIVSLDNAEQTYEQYAFGLIEDEMRKVQPRKMPPMPALTLRTPILQEAYNQIAQGQSDSDMSKSVWPGDASLISLDAHDNNKPLEDWQTALSAAKRQYENERRRQQALLLDLGKDDSQPPEVNNQITASTLWSRWIDTVLVPLHTQLSEMHEAQQAKLQVIHQERQSHQKTTIQPQLTRLDHQYNQVYTSINNLRGAIVKVKQQIQEAKEKVNENEAQE